MVFARLNPISGTASIHNIEKLLKSRNLKYAKKQITHTTFFFIQSSGQEISTALGYKRMQKRVNHIYNQNS